MKWNGGYSIKTLDKQKVNSFYFGIKSKTSLPFLIMKLATTPLEESRGI